MAMHAELGHAGHGVCSSSERMASVFQFSMHCNCQLTWPVCSSVLKWSTLAMHAELGHAGHVCCHAKLCSIL